MTRPSPGVFAGDLSPPKPWRTLGIKLHTRGNKDNTERTIGALTTAEFIWLGRVWEADYQRRCSERGKL